MHRARGRAAWSGRTKSGLWSCCGVTPGSGVPWDIMGCHRAASGQHRKVAPKWYRRQGSSLDVVEDSGGGDPTKDLTGTPKWWRCEGDAGHGPTSPARALNVLVGFCDGDVAPCVPWWRDLVATRKTPGDITTGQSPSRLQSRSGPAWCQGPGAFETHRIRGSFGDAFFVCFPRAGGYFQSKVVCHGQADISHRSRL